jgi:hypothetical protein
LWPLLRQFQLQFLSKGQPYTFTPCTDFDSVGVIPPSRKAGRRAKNAGAAGEVKIFA